MIAYRAGMSMAEFDAFLCSSRVAERRLFARIDNEISKWAELAADLESLRASALTSNVIVRAAA